MTINPDELFFANGAVKITFAAPFIIIAMYNLTTR
jgi:hypothetical protein